MRKPLFFILILVVALHFSSKADITITTTFVLDEAARQKLRLLTENNEQVKTLWLNLRERLPALLQRQPDPADIIYFEGLLDTDPKRINTTAKLEDMNVIADLLFSFYITGEEKYNRQMQRFIKAWADTYKPTGNPINENKLIPLIHAFTVVKADFTVEDRNRIVQWLDEIAEMEINNDRVPMNNWEAKRIKLVQSLAIATGKQDYADYALQHFKAYIDYSLYPDGTSRDLERRDALHYHLSGLDPLLSYGIMMDQLQPEKLNVYTYQAEDGASIQKSIDYVLPYAQGLKTRKEWLNSKVKLDQERAKAGLEAYQPGKLFDPRESLDTFTLAFYFNDKYLPVVRQLSEKDASGNNIYSWDRVLVMTLKK